MRVPRYFAFIDLCGFTRFTDAHGDQESVAMLTEFRTLVREVASDHGVRVAKWLGDGAMFVSTQADPMLRMVLELEGRVEDVGLTLPLRIGVAGGDTILFEGDDYIGTPVNLAARLCDVAAPFEVLACADLVPQLPDGLVATAPVELTLPGLVRQVAVVRLPVPARNTG
jgi:adenylate cyclase